MEINLMCGIDIVPAEYSGSPIETYLTRVSHPKHFIRWTEKKGEDLGGEEIV